MLFYEAFENKLRPFKNFGVIKRNITIDMTELKWLKLSGLMRRCVYNKENPACPFTDFRKQDSYEQLESLGKIGDSLGNQLLGMCNSCRFQCKPIVNNDLEIANTRHFKVVG